MDTNKTQTLRLTEYDSPAWRWKLAGHLARHQRPPVVVADDDALRQVVDYRRARRRANTPTSLEALHRRHPDIAAAHKIYVDAGVLRDEIEARLLARQDLSRISAATGISESVLAAYAAVFYNLPKLGQGSDWVITNVLHMDEWGRRDITESDVWRYAAIAGGPVLVDSIVADHLGRREPVMDSRHELAQRLRSQVREIAQERRSLLPTPAIVRRMEKDLKGALSRCDAKERRMLEVHLSILRMAAGGTKPRRVRRRGAKAAARHPVSGAGAPTSPANGVATTPPEVTSEN